MTSTEASKLYDAQLCYILDFFLGLYGLFITAMFIKEKVGQSKRSLLKLITLCFFMCTTISLDISFKTFVFLMNFKHIFFRLFV